ncbi:MAG: hypothetical protein M9894_31430 [Planctomycetes bacterium]|nr:hypothetical protein [Planctomycetota bacterium]
MNCDTEPRTGAADAREPHDQDEALERAERELEGPERDAAIRHAEGAAERAASRALVHWAFWLVLVGVLVTSVVHDARLLIVAVLLAIFYAIPYLVAGLSTAWGEEERRDLARSLHEHERHEHERRAHPEPPARAGAGERRTTGGEEHR